MKHENKEIELIFVRSERNCADLCTKNLPESLFKTHSDFVRRGYFDPLEVDEEEFLAEVGTFGYNVNCWNPWWDEDEDKYIDFGGRISRQHANH